jgi:starch phosphorylase
MVLSNPRLAHLLTSRIGSGWIHDLDKLRRLESMIDEPEFCDEWTAIKQHNKTELSNFIQDRLSISTDPASIFDVLVKRLHEYKRQHLQILHILTLYKRIQRDPDCEMVPRTFLFGGKAAPDIEWPSSSSSSFIRWVKRSMQIRL